MPPKRTAKRKFRFCAECGDQLDQFWREPEAKDVRGVILHMAKCKAEGKFKGDLCSRLWIAAEEKPRPTATSKRLPKGKLNTLKSGIVKRIAAEDRRSGPTSRRTPR